MTSRSNFGDDHNDVAVLNRLLLFFFDVVLRFYGRGPLCAGFHLVFVVVGFQRPGLTAGKAQSLSMILYRVRSQPAVGPL